MKVLAMIGVGLGKYLIDMIISKLIKPVLAYARAEIARRARLKKKKTENKKKVDDYADPESDDDDFFNLP